MTSSNSSIAFNRFSRLNPLISLITCLNIFHSLKSFPFRCPFKARTQRVQTGHGQAPLPKRAEPRRSGAHSVTRLVRTEIGRFDLPRPCAKKRKSEIAEDVPRGIYKNDDSKKVTFRRAAG